MANSPLTDNERVFWSRFSKHLIQKPESVRWYRIRAEQFIRAFPRRRLASLTPDDISGYLLKVGEPPNLKPWQYAQVIDAIQILYKLARMEWSETFDWDYWRAHGEIRQGEQGPDRALAGIAGWPVERAPGNRACPARQGC